MLALNALHHFGKDWQDVLEALTLMSDYVIVQTPYAVDKESCGGDIIPEILMAMLAVGRPLGESAQFEGHMPRPIFKVNGTFCPKLTMSSWTSPENCIDAPIIRCSTARPSNLRHKQIVAPRPEPKPSSTA